MAGTPAPPPSAETYSAIGPMTVLPGADELEVALTATVHAPRERVYEAFTDAELLKQWWGPEGYTVTQARTEPHPSGSYSLVMRAPDGTEYPVHGLFVQADEPDRVVMTDVADGLPQDWPDLTNEYRGEDDRELRLVVRVLFEDASNGGTMLTIRNRFPAVTQAALLQAQVMDGWHQSLAKLERLLVAEGLTVR